MGSNQKKCRFLFFKKNVIKAASISNNSTITDKLKKRNLKVHKKKRDVFHKIFAGYKQK
jgi:hypothetical protein